MAGQPKLATETGKSRVYLDRISSGHVRADDEKDWMKCLIQPIAVPNLEHCGIRTVFNSFKGVEFDEEDFAGSEPLQPSQIRHLVAKKFPFQAGASARATLPPMDGPETKSPDPLAGKHGNTLALFQTMLDSAYSDGAENKHGSPQGKRGKRKKKKKRQKADLQ
jgi:hypothetical protein